MQEEKTEVTSNGSENDVYLGMTRRSAQLEGMGLWKEGLCAWGMDRIWETWNSQCRISKLILEATRNAGVLEASWKTSLELAILPVERDQLKTVKRFLTVFHRSSKALQNLLRHQEELSGGGTGKSLCFST